MQCACVAIDFGRIFFVNASRRSFPPIFTKFGTRKFSRPSSFVTENGSTLCACAAAEFLCFCAIFSISRLKTTFFIQSSPYLGISLIAWPYVTVHVFDETGNRLLIRRASDFRFCKGSRYKLVQNHTKRLLIAKISDPCKKIVVAESNGCIYFWPTIVPR